jgi:hypothetical protein
VAAISCAENRATFFIQQMQVPGDDCTVESDESGLYRTYGVLDVAFSQEYSVYPLMRNQMIAMENSDNAVAETNGIQVEGANIRFWLGGRPQEGEDFSPFYQPASSYIRPDSVTVSGFLAIPQLVVLRLFGVESADELTLNEMSVYVNERITITVGITMLGTTNDGQEVQTPEFYFPVHLCFGCQVYCPIDSGDEEHPLCEAPTEPAPFGCRLGEDGPVDCRWFSSHLSTQDARDICFNNL